MARRNVKVGDRIFFEYYDNSIGEAIVQSIEPRSYKRYDDGKRTYVDINFNMLHLGSHTIIEDYNCLSERDPRVIEYKKTHTDSRKFVKLFEKFMKDNKFDIHSQAIQDYLYGVMEK